jgi:hypothetical protein
MIQRLAALIFLTAGLTSPLLAGPEFWYEDNNSLPGQSAPKGISYQ